MPLVWPKTFPHGIVLLPIIHAVRDLATLLSYTEVVTLSAVMREQASKVTTFAGNLFRNGSEPKLKARTIEAALRNSRVVLAALPHKTLLVRLRSSLKHRMALQTESSDTAISVALIECAARHLDIDDDLTISQRAQFVTSRYFERLLESVKKNYAGLGADKKAAVDAAIRQNLDSLSPEHREDLRRALGVDTLTAEAIRSVLFSAGPGAGLLAVQMTGFGAYLALTTVMHAVFTTMLGVTLPFAFYTGATSFLSVLLGPVGIGLSLLTLGVGGFWAHRKIRGEIAALVVFSLAAYSPIRVPSTDALPSSPLLSSAAAHDAELRKVQDELRREREQHSSVRTQLSQADSKLLDHKRRLEVSTT
jgi:hypothetical protein